MNKIIRMARKTNTLYSDHWKASNMDGWIMMGLIGLLGWFFIEEKGSLRVPDWALGAAVVISGLTGLICGKEVHKRRSRRATKLVPRIVSITETLGLSVFIVLALGIFWPAHAWEACCAPPAPPSGFGGYSQPAPNPPQSMWMQQVGPNTELYQNSMNPTQGGTVQQVGPGTSITTPNDGSPPVVCQQNGPMTVCN